MAELSYLEARRLKSIISNFYTISGELKKVDVFEGGRINSTYEVLIRDDETGEREKYLLQRLNHEVFNNIEALMSNSVKVTDYLRKNGHTTIHFIPTKNGGYIYDEVVGEFWRMYEFIEATVYSNITNPEDMYSLGIAVGDFYAKFIQFEPNNLEDTIPGFHDTRRRMERFKTNVIHRALSNEPRDREKIEKARKEIEFALRYEKEAGILIDALNSGSIPFSVTHNDPKLNNVLFKKGTNEVLCMIDLDTVMKGTILFDIGDAIRYSANTTTEEEKDLSKVSIDLELFRNFVEGFMAVAKRFVTKNEVDLIAISVLILALELGIRFLDDYLNDNAYFQKITYPEQNLDRARVQFSLVGDIEVKLEQMKEIVLQIWNKD